ncbi:MAG: MoaD/ThiS family protein [Myxococcales bacterium]|nr:MoaD/ThiS family protein [Myxococcales bacterium]
MGVNVELTYEMGKLLGEHHFELQDVHSVAEVLDAVRARFGDRGERLTELSRHAAVAVNGVLVNYKKGKRTRLQDGDRVSFVKASAGG